MAAISTPNADLEQSLFKANLKETKLRQRIVMTAIIPAVVGVLWLGFSIYEVTTLQARARVISEREQKAQVREEEAHKQISEADAKRIASETAMKEAQAQEKAAKARADDMQQRLVNARTQIGTLAPLLTDISSIRNKASKLMASEAVETDLTDMRILLGKTLGRIEQEFDKGLPAAEQKTRVYLYAGDDAQRDTAKTLVPILEGAGFDAVIAKNPTPSRKIDPTEIRFFRELDRTEAGRLQTLLVAQPGLADAKLALTPDADHATGSKKLQVWFEKK
jgi:hypothetical protein